MRSIPRPTNGRYWAQNKTVKKMTEYAEQNEAENLKCTPFVRQYDILSEKWGVNYAEKEYQINDIHRQRKRSFLQG